MRSLKHIRVDLRCLAWVRMASSDRDEVEAQGEEDEDDQEAKTPRCTPSHSRSYADSPGKEKRKRMENLALLRSKKQRVF